MFVDVFDRFPIQTQMPCNLRDGHHMTQLINVACHAFGHPQVWMKKPQILDAHALASRAEQLAVAASDPYPGTGQIQIAYATFGPTVDTASFLTATMTHGLISLAGLGHDTRLAGIS